MAVPSDIDKQQPNKIEGKCWCGCCIFCTNIARSGYVDESGEFVPDEERYWWLQASDLYPGYCPTCGCRLVDNGFAYRMVPAAHTAEEADRE